MLLFVPESPRSQSAILQVGSAGVQTNVEGTVLAVQEPFVLALRSFTVETMDDGVHVGSGLVLGKTTILRSLLRDGAVLTLTCKLTLERLRTLLTNDTESELTVEYHLRHDLLTREFVLNYTGTKPLRHKNLDALLSTVWKTMHFTLPLHRPLLSGKNYRVRFDLALQHAEVPPWLEKALFFWSWDVASPASFSREFIY